jgi:hypothetical protein
MSAARKLLTLSAAAAITLLCTGASCSGTRPDTPTAGVTPQVITVVEVRYRDLPDALLKDCEIAEGAIHEIGEVTRLRKLALQKCNADKAELRALRGTKPDD